MPVVPACLPSHGQNQNSALNQEMNLWKPQDIPPPPPREERLSSTGKNLCFEPKATSGGSWHSTLHWQCFIILTQWGLFPLTLRRYVTQPSVPFPARLQQVVLIIDFPTPYCFQQALRGDCYELRGIYLPLKANLLV